MKRLLPLLFIILVFTPLTTTADNLFNQFGSMFGGGSGGGQNNTPTIDIGRLFNSANEALGNVSPEKELAIGREAASLLLGTSPLLASDSLQKYVNQVGFWVALQSERPDLDWQFGVLDTDDINSFAAPGGFVFITKGLLLLLDSEAELAAVLAHECAHIIQRHYLAAVQKNAKMDLAAEMVSTAVRTNNRQLLDRVLNSSRELYARGLDKEDEYEADRMAAVLAARAGYEAFGIHMVMQRLATTTPDDSRLAFLFKTHPSPDRRLEALDFTIEPLAPFAYRPTLRRRFHQQLLMLMGR